MVHSLARNLLLRVLKRKGWVVSREKTDLWLKKENYYLLLTPSEWKLWVDLKGDLILVKNRIYGRRQSQEVNRAMEKDKKERRRCSSTK